jgi:aspartate/methionine/tyrosine aminotransferase
MKSKTTIIDGFSKTYAMTGWRLGYGVMRKDLAEKISQLIVNSNSCTSAFSQMAGVEALTGSQEEVKNMVETFRQRREVISSGLNSIDGITCKKPNAAFYVFPNIRNLNMSSKEMTDFLLNKAGVSVLSGTSFGAYGEGYIRFSFANSTTNIQKALTRIEEALKTL